MRDNLFRRYINMFAGMLLACTILLGVAFLYFSAQNFTTDKQIMLENAAERARELITSDTTVEGSTLVVDDKLVTGFKTIFESSGATVFFADADGTVQFCSDGGDCIHKKFPVSKKVLELAVKKGKYESADYFEGVFTPNKGTYQYCVPVWGENDSVIGFVFAVTPIATLYAFLINLGITFLAAVGVMLICAVLIIYNTTKQLTKPLHEMSAAAKIFGSGDFSARVNVEGDDEIANLATAFNNMAESLSEFERTRTNFIANVSHELRTPMTTIGGYIDGILDGTIPRSRENHYLSIVSDEVKRLSRLTSSLLDITRLEDGAAKATLKTCNAWDVVLSVMWNAEKRIVDKQLEVTELEVSPCYIMCDPDMFYQVVYNLLDNAIKFTPKNGEITVKVEPAGSLTNISIRNTGGGVSNEELQHIFERFYKTDKSRGLDKMGTGLGLYIVKTLVGKMDGTIAASSELNKYTEFTLSFKTGAEEKGRQKNQNIPVFSTARPKVKIIPNKESWIDKLSRTIRRGK